MCGDSNLKPERRIQFGRTTYTYMGGPRNGSEMVSQGEDLISLLQDKNHWQDFVQM
jgi:hypothetical protein